MSDTESMEYSLDEIDDAIVKAAALLALRIERGFTVTIARRFENREIETSVQVMADQKGAA